MSVLGASSRGGGGIESDGTHAVICYLCRQVICRTTQGFTRALCAICEASEQGKELTVEAINAYNASRMVLSGVAMLVLQEEQPSLPGLKKKFVLSDLGQGMSRALGFLGLRKPDKTMPSAGLARNKRRQPLLAGLNVGDSGLGDMDRVDTMLRKDRD